jgi:DNA primase|tara:strand:- start:548 stop:1855 length:1308 start_codon:yes stop_codon:yes gene_type:complete
VEVIKMGKISPVSAKYIIHTSIDIDGIVDRPDVIGAIFGQTEGLLGSELELRELQRSGRIGRIEVNVDTVSGKTTGTITVPSSLDKAETSIVGAALEIIQRIGPCNSRIKVSKIEDVRISKRNFVIERAKELLKELQDGVLPDSQELADEVAYSVRVMEIKTYGNDRLPAGPAVDESDDIILVEGRADVVNLLKHSFKNTIALNGTNVPQTIIDLSKKKVMTAFVDGDRGGNLILKELFETCEIDYVTKAPDGKEVEEITKKEIHKALRNRVSAEQAAFELGKDNYGHNGKKGVQIKRTSPAAAPVRPSQSTRQQPPTTVAKNTSPSTTVNKYEKKQLSMNEKKTFNTMLEELIGTRGAFILDEKLNILGKVPTIELVSTVRSLATGVYSIVFDGIIERDLVQVAEKTNIRYLIGMDTRIKSNSTNVGLLTSNDL